MRIYWKALLGYGFVFWIILCILDFLGITTKSTRNIEEFYEYVKPLDIEESDKEKSTSFTFEYKGYKFTWPILLWNTVTFVVSIVLCSAGRSLVLGAWDYYRTYRNRSLFKQVATSNTKLLRSQSTLSRIPIIVKANNLKGSEIILRESEQKTNQEKKSCPNLLTKSNVSNFEPKKLKSLYSNDSFSQPSHQPKDKSNSCSFGVTQPKHSPLSLVEQLEKQVHHYKEELIRLQSSSLKEHAALSRKLEQVYKERTDLFKQLTIAHKETRGAKTQLEELLQEKTDLLRKMDHATKELKANTKTKKMAFAKLEEFTTNIDELRVQLEQVSRDKEILEKKLRLMEGEYNKLHERYIATQEKMFNTETDENVPERDKRDNEDDNNSSDNNPRSLEYCDTTDASNSGLPNPIDALASVSQTQFDMDKIQEKIKQLEKNLEQLNYSAQNLTSFEGESDISLSVEPTSDSLTKDEDTHFTPESGYSEKTSPRARRFDWPSKVVELIGKNKNKFAQIQEMATKLKAKTDILEQIKTESSQLDYSSSEDDELYSSDEKEPTRIVSNSAAFKNFMKGLSVKKPRKRQISPSIY